MRKVGDTNKKRKSAMQSSLDFRQERKMTGRVSLPQRPFYTYAGKGGVLVRIETVVVTGKQTLGKPHELSNLSSG